MDYKNKNLCRVRTITLFLSLDKNQRQWKTEIAKASNFLSKISKQLNHVGYDVQSVRIVTNPFGEYLNTSTIEAAKNDLNTLSGLLTNLATDEIRVRFAIGEAVTRHEISLLPELIKDFGDLCNACVNIGVDNLGVLDNKLILNCVETIIEISKITPRGEGNFNFTVNCNCAPLIPYFPASYYKTELGTQFVIGLETPDLLVHVLKHCNETSENETHCDLFDKYYKTMHQALQHHISNIKEVIDDSMYSTYKFAGFDSSAAPSKSCSSITKVYELMGVEHFGAVGTIEASSLLTMVFKSVKNVDLVGFSGLMLALTEDTGLATGSIKGHFDIQSLLTYSAVCGIGLDTVPIPGNTPAHKIATLIRDTGTMAYRLNKPLTVRLFPVPKLNAGDITTFESDD